MSKIDCESQNETLPSTLTGKSFNFGSSFLGNSEDSFFIDPEDHISNASRPSFFDVIKGNKKRGSVFIHAQQRITQIIQDRVTKARKNKNDEIKVLEDRYFGLINLSSSLLWYTTIIILILYILQMELLASYSPILNSISRLSGKLNTSITHQNRSANYIYQNVQPNCWNIYLEDDVLTEHWSDLERQNMIDELNGMFNLEFPEQLEDNSAFDSLKYKPRNWLKKYTTDENIDLFVKVPKPNNSTYRIPMNQLTEHSSDYDMSQYCKIMFHILVAVQCLLACNYHYANYNLRSLHHVMSASTLGSEDGQGGTGKSGGKQSKIHRRIENKTLLKFMILDLIIFSCFYSMYGIFIRALRIWWLYSREVFREQKLSRKIRLNADQKVLRLFWFKYKFRHHPLKIVTKVCGSMMLVVSWILFLVERYNGYCRSFSWQFWAITGAMTGVGLDQVYKKTIYDTQMQVFIYILTLTYGIFWTGLIVSVVMDLFNFPMQTGELEIEKVRCREQMEKAAARFLLSGWRRFVIKKEVAELISINNELVNDQLELATIRKKHKSQGNENKLEALEEQETEMTRKMDLLNEHLIWLTEQATLFRNKRGILHKTASVKEAMHSPQHDHDSDSEDEDSMASRENCNINRIVKSSSMEFSATNMLRNKIYEDKRYKPGQPQQAINVKTIGPKLSDESSGSENKGKNTETIQTIKKLSKESNATVITNTPISATKLETMKQYQTNLHSTNKLQQKIDKILKTVDVAFKDKLAVWREKRIAMQNQMNDIDDDINQAKTHATTQKMMQKMSLLESQNNKVLKKLEKLEGGSQGFLDSSISKKRDIVGGSGGYVLGNTFSKTSVRTGVMKMYN